MVETKIIEKYKGTYLKEFQTEEELKKYIDEHYEIIEMYIKDKSGKWQQV